MDKFNFKDALKSMKQNLSKDGEKKFVLMRDVIKEKSKDTKQSELFRNFEDIEKESDEWAKKAKFAKLEKLNNQPEVSFEFSNASTLPIIAQTENKTKEDISSSSILTQKEPEEKKAEELEDSNKQKNTLGKDNRNEDGEHEEGNAGLSQEEIIENDQQVKPTKEYKVTIDPKKAIIEECEQGEKKRYINVDQYTTEYKCNELFNWFHSMFLEWEKELDSLSPVHKETVEAKYKLGIYKQCRGYIRSLLKSLKQRKISKEIMNKLFEVMIFCLDRDYVRAHDKYIELAIGNAPWPMGVTMVGIHERSGRSRIYTSQVAHILNDDNTKKYLQSVKRIMSLVQRRYPEKPSKCVFS